MTDPRVKNMRSLRTRLWDALIVFSLLFVCLIASINSGLVGATGQSSVTLGPNLGIISYSKGISKLIFATSYEDFDGGTAVLGYPSNEGSYSHSVINTATGLPISIYFAWAESSSYSNFAWVEPDQSNYGITPHSGSRCLGFETNNNKRIELNIYFSTLGLTDKFYYSGWFYLPSDFNMNPLTWLGIFQPWEYNWWWQQIVLEYQGTQGNPSLDHFTVALNVATGGSGRDVETVTGVRIQRGQWHHLEVYQEQSTTNGRHVLWLDGTQLWDVSGFPTTNAIGSGHIEFNRIYHATTSQKFQIWYDDVEFWDGIP